MLCEILQNSDVTWRLWDYGRPRELHVQQAVAISDLGVHPGAARPTPISEGRDELVRCRHFVTELVRLAPGAPHTPTPEQCQMLICIEGCGTIGSEAFQAGNVAVPRSGPSSPRCTRKPARVSADLRAAVTRGRIALPGVR